MNDFFKMDIFFVVTTFAVVLLTGAITIVLIRLWRVLGSVERISTEIEAETKLIRADVSEVRASAKREGLQVVSLVRLARESLQRIFRRGRSK